ncbi:MAG: hypothetical protein KY476_05145 [Planctomycetes bacterium]|nr:hypothetical protein [Planctomycetota bacterium]
MNSLERFWLELRENLAFLLLLLPLVGAVLTALSAGMGREAVRRTALTNALVSLGLVVVMVAHYRPQAGDTEDVGTLQMVTRLAWLPAAERAEASAVSSVRDSREPAVTISVGVDGVSLWLVAVTVVLTVAAIACGADSDRERPAALYIIVLVFETASIGTFTALDGLLFAVCFSVSTVCCWLLVGGWGGHERREAARALFAVQAAGTLLVLVGIIGLALSAAHQTAELSEGELRTTFLMPMLLDEPAAPGWVTATLVLGFFLRAGILPFHGWFARGFASASPAVAILLAGVFLPTGGYGLWRFVVPLMASDDSFGPQTSIAVAQASLGWALFGCVLMALLSLAQSELPKLLAYLCLSRSSLAACAMLSGDATAVSGAVLQLVELGLSLAVAVPVVGWLDRRFRTGDLSAFGGLTHALPRAGVGLAVAVLVLIGIPATAGFIARLLVVFGVTRGGPGGGGTSLAAWTLVAWFLITWALLSASARMLRGRPRLPRALRPQEERLPSDAADDLPRERLFLVAALAALLFIVGVWPRSITDRTAATIDSVLPAAMETSP